MADKKKDGGVVADAEQLGAEAEADAQQDLATGSQEVQQVETSVADQAATISDQAANLESQVKADVEAEAPVVEGAVSAVKQRIYEEAQWLESEAKKFLYMVRYRHAMSGGVQVSSDDVKAAEEAHANALDKLREAEKAVDRPVSLNDSNP